MDLNQFWIKFISFWVKSDWNVNWKIENGQNWLKKLILLIFFIDATRFWTFLIKFEHFWVSWNPFNQFCCDNVDSSYSFVSFFDKIWFDYNIFQNIKLSWFNCPSLVLCNMFFIVTRKSMRKTIPVTMAMHPRAIPSE